MDTVVEFQSLRFRPFLPDDCQVNPGRFGAELAFWLSQKLAERGVATSYPSSEDWGWFVEFTDDQGAEHWLCCANIDGSDSRWKCFLDAKSRKLFGRGRASVEGAVPLIDALRAVLADDPEITDIVWSRAA